MPIADVLFARHARARSIALARRDDPTTRAPMRLSPCGGATWIAGLPRGGNGDEKWLLDHARTRGSARLPRNRRQETMGLLKLSQLDLLVE